MANVKCPNCSAEVHVGEQPWLGQRETCRECGKSLEVIWLFPLELDYSEDDGSQTVHEKTSSN